MARAALKITKIQIFSFRGKNVRLFEVMTKTSVLSDKNVPLPSKLAVEIFAKSKGQLISKCPFGVFKSSKKPTEFFQDFWP